MNEAAITIPQRLEQAAQEISGELVFHLENGPRRIPAQELWEEARKRAEHLVSRNFGRGERVGIVGANGPDWALWAFGAWVAGATLVPLQYSLGVRDRSAVSEQLNRLANRAGCKAVMCDRRFESHFPPEGVVLWDAALPAVAGDVDIKSIRHDDVATIQFTSGSTGAQKGVLLEHGSILHSVRSTSKGLGVTPADRFAGWAPLYHDLGLFGYLLRPMVMGCEGHILPTERFARDPSEWFKVMTEARATLTTAPASGYAIAMKRAELDPSGLDLSDMRAAIFGAEMIVPEIVERLRAFGRRVGMDPDSVSGSYGMAEATLTISIQTGGMRSKTIHGDRLMDGSSDGSVVREICSCGPPVPGVDVRITKDGDEQPNGRVGEIEIRSRGLMRGYIGVDPSSIFSDEGWFRTGDLGFMSDNELFVTGRLKDVIIVMGATYSPEDIEWASGKVNGVRVGRCVAFGRPGGADGEVVVALEAKDENDISSLTSEVRRSVSTSVGVTPKEVIVLPKGSIPKTTSGKLRRGAVRDAYGRGELIGLN